MSKEARKGMHGAIREHFPGLESRTEESGDGGKNIIVQRRTTVKRGNYMHRYTINPLP